MSEESKRASWCQQSARCWARRRQGWAVRVGNQVNAPLLAIFRPIPLYSVHTNHFGINCYLLSQLFFTYSVASALFTIAVTPGARVRPSLGNAAFTAHRCPTNRAKAPTQPTANSFTFPSTAPSDSLRISSQHPPRSSRRPRSPSRLG